MSIKVKAIERNVSFEKNTEKWAYVLQPELYSKLSATKVIQEAALRSGIAKGAINAAWDAIGEVIKAWATEGHSVAVPGLGTMRFGLRSSSVEDVNLVSAKIITSRRVIFTPNTEIKQELQKTPVSITCYDRNGNIVKQVTSSDDGTVEDPENTNNAGNTGNTGNAGNTGNTGNTGHSGDSGNTGNTDQTTPTPPASGDMVITAQAQPAAGGTVSGGGSYASGASVTLTATPNSGYKFLRWNDGDTNAEKTITVTESKTYNAIFSTI